MNFRLLSAVLSTLRGLANAIFVRSCLGQTSNVLRVVPRRLYSSSLSSARLRQAWYVFFLPGSTGVSLHIVRNSTLSVAIAVMFGSKTTEVAL